ncbi:MAG: heme NO-binding domain-containing protein [Acidobacteriota bacterium]
MYGLIFAELQDYVISRFSKDTWELLLKEAGLWPKIYLNFQEYPDQEAIALITTASRLTGKPPEAIIEDFGEFIVPSLLKVYMSLIKPEWRTLDLIENTEEIIHTIIRRKTTAANPPTLQCERVNEKQIILTYDSPRKMCTLAKGIIKGIAKHYNETISINQTTCMLTGSPNCKISVALSSLDAS